MTVGLAQLPSLSLGSGGKEWIDRCQGTHMASHTCQGLQTQGGGLPGFLQPRAGEGCTGGRGKARPALALPLVHPPPRPLEGMR